MYLEKQKRLLQKAWSHGSTAKTISQAVLKCFTKIVFLSYYEMPTKTLLALHVIYCVAELHCRPDITRSRI